MMNANKFNILIVHNYYQIPGGEDTVVANEMKMLEEYGHRVILYSRNNSELKEMNFFHKLIFPITTIYNIRTVKDIRKIIKEEQIDIVHVHNTLSLISPSVYYAARSCSIPVVQTIHNFRLLCPGASFYRNGHICEDCVKQGLKCAIRHRCYRNSKIQTMACVLNIKFHRMMGIYGKINYICLTEFNKSKLIQLNQIKENKVFVKPNFTEGNKNFLPKKQRTNSIIFAGRLDKLKGIDILLDVWKQMGNSAPELIICGNGPMENWCKLFIQKNNLKNVKLLGLVKNEEVKKLIAHSKALILPTQWYEGFPMSIVEAYSMGTPVICSDIGNAANLVKNGVTGYKLKSYTQNNLNSVIEDLNSNSQIYESTFGEYQEKYTCKINYHILYGIYESIIRNK